MVKIEPLRKKTAEKKYAGLEGLENEAES